MGAADDAMDHPLTKTMSSALPLYRCYCWQKKGRRDRHQPTTMMYQSRPVCICSAGCWVLGDLGDLQEVSRRKQNVLSDNLFAAKVPHHAKESSFHFRSVNTALSSPIHHPSIVAASHHFISFSHKNSNGNIIAYKIA